MTEQTFLHQDLSVSADQVACPDDPRPLMDRPSRSVAGAAEDTSVKPIVEAVCKRVAPVWPLRHFVAVNPFLGFSDERFIAAAARLRRTTGADLLMPRSFYRAALEQGRLTRADLKEALSQGSGRVTGLAITDLEHALALDRAEPQPAVTTVAELAAACGLVPPGFVTDEIGKWCAAYWDQGQSSWRMPWRDRRPYAAWRLAAAHDRTPDVMGLSGFRRLVTDLPDDPHATVATVLERLAVPDAAREVYLQRALATIGGWAAYARYLGWQHELSGDADDSLAQVLAIRLAWEGALFGSITEQAFRPAWRGALKRMSALKATERSADLTLDGVLQDAYERAFQRQIRHRLTAATRTGPNAAGGRPAVQAAFCIDVRSEVFRRALETTSLRVETLGFAGFFGFPIEYVPIGQHHGGAQCPVLLKPRFIVCETVQDASGAERRRVLERRIVLRRVHKAWKAFKTAAVSSFSYVETAGLLSGAKLVSDTLGLTRTVAHPADVGLSDDIRQRVGPDLSPSDLAGRRAGFTPDERVAMAEAVLRAMSLQDGFARLVLLVGHGSSTVNNPHGSGLDCGACGGHTGEANARVAAAILNDRAVRAGLVERGLVIPEDTWFLAGLHDTTTDAVSLFELDRAPSSHAAEIEALRGWLAAAAALVRAERATLLGIAPADQRRLAAKFTERSRDWSQVRPEWGLAGNAAFIAAPRHRTRGLDLQGRAFLHSYDWQQDETFGVLELIMTAPLVVASWINLQYYGSTVDNRAFGAGNKVLHNVVGTFGVLEGNGGDLRTGLPWQSVHDGTKLAHEPVRLSAYIEAPRGEIERVLRAHEGVRQLVENGWVHLFQIDGDGTVHRYGGAGSWQPG